MSDTMFPVSPPDVTMRQAQMKAWEEITNQMNLFYPDQMRDKWELKTKFRSMVRRVKQKVSIHPSHDQLFGKT